MRGFGARWQFEPAFRGQGLCCPKALSLQTCSVPLLVALLQPSRCAGWCAARLWLSQNSGSAGVRRRCRVRPRRAAAGAGGSGSTELSLTGASEFYLTGAMLFISCFSSSWCKYCSPNLKTNQTKNPPPPKIPEVHHLQAQELKEAFQKFRELFFLSSERHCQSFATAK